MSPAAGLAQSDFLRLDELFDAETAARLAREAEAARASARPWSSTDYALSRSGQLSSPRSHRSGSPGGVLRALHEGNRVRELLRELTGLHFFATRASYLFYEPGDFIGLHTDLDACQVTLVTSVLGSPDPLVLHPELAAMPGPVLLALSRRSAGVPAGGEPVAVPHGGVLVLRGSRVPHHRPPARSECAVATLCYAALE